MDSSAVCSSRRRTMRSVGNRWVQIFSHWYSTATPHSSNILQLTGTCPPKLPLDVRGSGLLPNRWFHGPRRVHVPNGIWIGSAVFAQQLTVVPNKHTQRHRDNATCDVCNNRPSLCTVCRRCGLIIVFTVSVLCHKSVFWHLRLYTLSICWYSREWLTCTSRCSNHTVTCPVPTVKWIADGFSRSQDSHCIHSESKTTKKRLVWISVRLLMYSNY